MIVHYYPRACSSVRSSTATSISSQVSPLATRRWLSSASLERLQQPIQSYISASRDPYVNLSFEHYLLQKSSAESAVLFLYVNRPSIIIGRNQNPWLEVNLALLNPSYGRPETEPPGLGTVDLVRRRSGGGTVFHDQGNVNWTVICPSAQFTRDKHAEMVVRALRSCGIDRACVNARHDIVLDQGSRGTATDPDDTHSTPYEATDFDTPRPLKVSGSAYKLTRGRALHHGTCLLSSPNLNIIPDYLHSPAKAYITARGVESVSSPVGNVMLSNDDFIAAVRSQFGREWTTGQPESVSEVGEECLEVDEIRKGYEELKSLEWTYLQTPQFTISTGDDFPDFSLDLSIKHGAVQDGTVDVINKDKTRSRIYQFSGDILGLRLHETSSWGPCLQRELGTIAIGREYPHNTASWMERMLPSAK